MIADEAGVLQRHPVPVPEQRGGTTSGSAQLVLLDDVPKACTCAAKQKRKSDNRTIIVVEVVKKEGRE
jgi:hypothetical protein